MAKKSAKSEASATPAAGDKAAAPKKAPKKKAATKAAAPKKVAAAKTAAPKKAVKTKVPKAAAPKAAAKAKSAAIKLTDSQKDLLSKVAGAGEGGYEAAKPMEERTLAALVERKLIKKGAKNKATGKVPHTVTAGGKKHIESSGSAS